MPTFRLLPLLALLSVLVLSGCKVTSGDIRMGAEATAFGTLYGVHADVPTATKVQTIAHSVAESTTGGVVDWEALHKNVDQQIKDNFPPGIAVFIVALGNDLVARVMAALPPDPQPNQLLEYANAAASGVELGAGFYIEYIRPTPLTLVTGTRKSGGLHWWHPH